jgi:hypothetical protein
MKYFSVKNSLLAIFKSISAGNHPFLVPFLYSGGAGAYKPPLTPSTTTPCLGTCLPLLTTAIA